MVIIYIHPKAKAGQLVWLDGVGVTFESCRDPQGQRVLAAQVRLSDRKRVTHAINRHPDFWQVDYDFEPWTAGRAVERAEAQAEVRRTEVSAALALVQEVRSIALTRRWSEEDLVGTGEQGDPSPNGGRSPRTAMSLSEMALTGPPSEWETAADVSYPWEHMDWSPPTTGWVPPEAPTKRPAEEWEPPDAIANLVKARLADRDAGDLEGEVIDELAILWEDDGLRGDIDIILGGIIDDLEHPVQDGEDAGAIDPDGDATVTPGDIDDPEALAEALAAGTIAKVDDPAVAAGYPAENVDAARILAHEMQGVRGEGFHPNALNFLLKKADLPTVGADSLAGLLAVSS